MNTIDKLVQALEENTALLERIVDGKEWGAIEEYIDQSREALLQYRAEQAEPTDNESLSVWVVPSSGQFSFGPQDERFWVRMTPAAPNPSSTDSVAVAKLEPLMKRDLEMCASLMDESAAIMEAIKPEILESLPNWRWPITDELSGAASILRDRIEAAHNAKLKG